EPKAGSSNWQTLQIITLSTSPYLFVDATATNGLSRRYRSTLVSSPNAQRVGELVATVTWALPPNVYTNFTPSDLQNFANLGIILNDSDYTLQFPTNPLPGYWVVLGDQRVMADTNGNFRITVPAGVTNGYVVRRHDGRSTEAEANFAVSQLALPGQLPPAI